MSGPGNGGRALRRTGARGRLRAWLPTIFLAGAILVSSFRSVPFVLQGRHADKLLHLAVYGILAVLASRSGIRDGRPRPLLRALALTVIVGLADEAIQALGSRRTADLYDLLADAAGALAGVLVMRFFSRPDCRESIDNSVSH